MTTLLFIRHGNNPSLGSFLPGQNSGIHLDEQGIVQSRLVADSLDQLPIRAIYSSPLERTMQTVQPLASRLGFPVLPEPDWQEMDAGDWSGQPFTDLKKLPQWKALRENPIKTAFPGGESFSACARRVEEAAMRVIAAHTDDDSVVICSHSDIIKMALCVLTGIPLESFPRMIVDPASLSVLTWKHKTGRLVHLNLPLPYQYKAQPKEK